MPSKGTQIHKAKWRNCETCQMEILAINRQRFCRKCAKERELQRQKVWTVYHRDFTKKLIRQKARYHERKKEKLNANTGV